MNFKRSTFFALLLALLTFTLACRTAETIAQLRATPAVSRPRATRAPTHQPTQVSREQTQNDQASPTAILAVTDVPAKPTNAPPQPKPEQPTAAPKQAQPTRKPAAPSPVKPTNPPPPPPSPTSQFKYRIQESRCGPNVRTYIEGYVYEGSAAKNGILVRISQGPDGQPDPNDDYLTGTDKSKAGYFIQNIDVNNPHGGTWYLWVVDPGDKHRISEIAIVKTDDKRVEDTENNPGSCQSAVIKFSTSGPVSNPVRTTAPTRTPNPNATPIPTQDPLDDS